MEDCGHMQNSIALILARGGSKRVPRKNVRSFCGLPMIAWVSRAASSSRMFSYVAISTDDAEIAATAAQYGAVQYFQRPKSLADEYTDTATVLKDALEALQEQGRILPAYCCCLYGTSALVTPELLADGYKKITTTSCEVVMAVAEYPHPIERALQFSAQGELYYRQPEFVPKRTQDIKPSYHDVGLFYWFSVRAFFKHGGTSFVPLKKTAIIVPRSCAVDIDTEEDWRIAELLGSQRLVF